MATVIDSLLVELGLDASKFDAAQKKSVEGLRKFDTANAKSGKDFQIIHDKMADGVLKVKNALIGFTAVAVGATGFKDFVNQQVFGNAQLGRTSMLLNMSAKDLQTWGSMMQTVGGTAQDFQQTMQNIEGGIAGVKLGGDPTVVARLTQLGVTIKDGTVNMNQLSDALVKLKNEQGIQVAMNIAGQVGVTPAAFQLLIQGSDALSKLREQHLALSGVTPENIAGAQKLQAEWALLKQSADALGQSLFGEATPALEGLTEAMVKYSSASTKAINQGGFMALFPQFWENYKDWVKHPMGGAGSQGGATGSWESSGSGSKLPRNMRNNNPGNIEYGAFAKSHGATGSDGRFAIFPSMEAGTAAQAALLQDYKAKGINTIGGVVSKWSPAGDNGAANTNAYIADVSKRTGIDPNQPLVGGQWGAVQQAMAAHEGMTGAKVAAAGSGGSNSSSQVETHVGTIVVNTQATDANGIAKDIKTQVSQTGIISSGVQGNT